MTPEQKLKWAVLSKASEWGDIGPKAPEYPCENVDEIYESALESHSSIMQDAKDEVRCGGIETGIKYSDWSRHYESDAVAMHFPDGSWVGWTYWYGGGKHGEPSAIDWMDKAYDLICTEEQKMVTVRTFERSP